MSNTISRTNKEKSYEQFKKIMDSDLSDDQAVMDIIQNCSSSIYTGTFDSGDSFTLGIEKGVGMRISTYQSNNWIRINDYELEKDENGELFIVRSESYEKE